ncbi:MAG: fumarylacetoacetate hydrolase family protein [Victivallaceae bacterium]|jgi:2-keto-4-pentenoate hydratase/2-oxohepta-3-ene-1,7-dioic acid hydratase in catechol pathway
MEINVGGRSFKAERVFCIGRNYAAHAKELKNDIPDEPVIFCKPPTSLVSHLQREIPFPSFGRELHHEVEIVVLIGKAGKPESEADALNYVAGLAAGLDLTMRDVQDELRSKGLPWEKSKAFDCSAPVGGFMPPAPERQLDDLSFSCAVNGAVRQSGNTGNMLFPIPRLIVEIARYWKLLPGDLIFTGTPEGVGPLLRGDIIEVAFAGHKWTWTMSS